ncbi:disease resistance protein RGA2-like protein [Cinnamomum micranthum f. kanehirae]|uniref:Disease resistance protein RGA2-like protein n=1 Tax=Cinnamomum micranthum f. kanehirae TaxID=337451 RepID=A0A3S3NHG1_9MAGN|nr:disease resistance protein RGA2-like protein [Cinnamomum micranthum f. kanehirae]
MLSSGEAILKSEIWDLAGERDGILPALRLSYDHLPAHLKRCFAYCCLFHKGYSMYSNQLVWLWMAQGFIRSEGSIYFIKKEISCRMHDLIHDLARSVLGADILEVGDGKSQKNAEKIQHVSCELSRFSVESFNFKDLCCFKSLRTLILHGGIWNINHTCPVLTIPPDFFVNLRHIRILDLRRNHITELPESIGNLIQLRYLDLSWTVIERLPKSITRLYNLQTLVLACCFKLVEVPSDFSNLVNLRNLFLMGCSASIPFGGLKCLQYSQHFKVGREIGYRVNKLRDMKHLRGSLRISELENVVSVEEAKEAELKNKQKINHLELAWESHDMDSRQERIEEEVLNALQPHSNLEELEIKGYGGVRFPTWLWDLRFSKLVSIRLTRCKCRVLPPFGQLPSLKHLSLGELYGLEKVGREVYGDGMVKGFPSLEILCIWSMLDLEEWSALEGDMIHVSEVEIRNCSKLRVLPDIFPLTLDTLVIDNCPLVTEKCKEGGQYWSKISHIPNIEINDLDQEYEGEVIP